MESLFFAVMTALMLTSSPAAPLPECYDRSSQGWPPGRYGTQQEIDENVFVYAQAEGIQKVWTEIELCKITPSEVANSPKCNNLGANQRCLQRKRTKLLPNGMLKVLDGGPQIIKIDCAMLTRDLREEGMAKASYIFCGGPEPRMPALPIAHAPGECWPKFLRQQTAYYGSFVFSVLCQAPGYHQVSNRVVNNEAHSFTNVANHLQSDIDCSTLTSFEQAVLCGPKY